MEIVPLTTRDGQSVRTLYRTVTRELRRSGVDQWDWFYPNRFVIGQDLKSGKALGMVKDGAVVAAVVVDAEQSKQYSTIPWTDQTGRPACIHRLAVHPACQGQGLGKHLLQFAESAAIADGYTSIRLDVYSGNPGAVALYTKRGYERRGAVRYPMRKLEYYCFEKRLV